MVVELSGEMLTTEKTDALLKTIAYLSRHNLIGVLLLVHDSESARQIAKYAVHNPEFKEWLDNNEFFEMQEIMKRWSKVY